MKFHLSKRQQKRLVQLLLLLVVSVVGYFAQPTQTDTGVKGVVAPGFYAITSFEDGDTITVDMNGTKERVRMIGIDTPETQDPRKPVQCFGKAASEFTKALIGNNAVRLESDPLSGNRDRYNRLLRYVYLPDDRLVQAEILKQGYGFAYTSFPSTKSEEFIGYQKEARDQNRGLWSSCQPEQNQYGGYTSNPE